MQIIEYALSLGLPVMFLGLFSPPVIERIGPNGFIGIRLGALMASPEAWAAGHRAAWPLIRALCVASLVICLTCFVCTVVTGRELFSLIAVVSSVVLVGFGSLFAMGPATEAAQRVSRRD